MLGQTLGNDKKWHHVDSHSDTDRRKLAQQTQTDTGTHTLPDPAIQAYIGSRLHAHTYKRTHTVNVHTYSYRQTHYTETHTYTTLHTQT